MQQHSSYDGMITKGDTFINEDGWYCIHASNEDWFLDDYIYGLCIYYIEVDLRLSCPYSYNYKSMIDIFSFREESDFVAFKIWFL